MTPSYIHENSINCITYICRNPNTEERVLPWIITKLQFELNGKYSVDLHFHSTFHLATSLTHISRQHYMTFMYIIINVQYN